MSSGRHGNQINLLTLMPASDDGGEARYQVIFSSMNGAVSYLSEEPIFSAPRTHVQDRFAGLQSNIETVTRILNPAEGYSSARKQKAIEQLRTAGKEAAQVLCGGKTAFLQQLLSDYAVKNLRISIPGFADRRLALHGNLLVLSDDQWLGETVMVVPGIDVRMNRVPMPAPSFNQHKLPERQGCAYAEDDSLLDCDKEREIVTDFFGTKLDTLPPLSKGDVTGVDEDSLQSWLSGQNQVFHFNCHLGYTKTLTAKLVPHLRLSQGARATTDNLKAKNIKLWRAMAFLNTCQSAGAHDAPDDSMASHFLAQGASAVCATTSKVDTGLARMFARYFYYYSSIGNDVFDAVYQARRATLTQSSNPLALNYVCYAGTGLALHPAAA